MNLDELIIAARAVAQQQMAIDRPEEDRLILAYLAGVTTGGALVNAGVIANLVIAQSKL